MFCDHFHRFKLRKVEEKKRTKDKDKDGKDVDVGGGSLHLFGDGGCERGRRLSGERREEMGMCSMLWRAGGLQSDVQQLLYDLKLDSH